MANNSKEIKAPTRIESLIIRIMIIIGIVSIFNLLYFFFKVEYRGYLPLYIVLSIIILYGSLKKLYLWYHYFAISVPQTPQLAKDLKVDVLTTYFPGEPYEMILETLTAIKKIEYPHTTYLCDEANDPYLIKECKKLGVVHVTRDNRIDAKAGNINNALKMATGDICLILDPDHVPKPNFLDVVLPYFNDEKIGYVQVVQAYSNKPHTLVARGAAEQTFQFYGPMMMTMNSYGTVNAIGANCTFRRSALDSIGGHAPGLAEDMHTAMLLHAKGWQSVYVPEILAKGLVPADLTSYFKQQLKWSRGTFELLYSIYPKIFKNLTTRQKIHYALLPLHYLIGLIYLLGFLLPIGSLLLSEMPWTGNLLYFIAMSLPVFMSSLLIGTFIQKWVIEKNERGFHIIGGLLQITAWWVFLVGVVYTFIRKKVPYLPTPKSEEKTNFYILIPNMIIAILSIFAVVYGLYQDLTPFTLVMSSFALLNAVFMCFSIYLATRVTNKNQILRTRLEIKTISKLKAFKAGFIKLWDYLFHMVRLLALPLVLTSIYVSITAITKMENSNWNTVDSYNVTKTKDFKYLGIFYPSTNNGVSDIVKIKQLEQKGKVNFQLVSFYLPWGDSIQSELSNDYLQQIKNKGALPLITWEPWGSTFAISDSILDLKQEKRMLSHITEGYFDAYIKKIAMKIKNFENPVFLRFAHEFDNPSYPWSVTGNNTSEDFKQAWRYVHDLFYKLHVYNVEWVYNPWDAAAISAYYPGDDYVDWVGVDLLNYGDLNKDGIWHSFEDLYNPYHERLKKISAKPVLLAEFGSLHLGGDQDKWLSQAFTAMDTKYKEIQGVVYFNSEWDKNIPNTDLADDMEYLDWTFSGMGKMKSSFFKTYKREIQTSNRETVISSSEKYAPIPIEKGLRGIAYKKGSNWMKNYDLADKQTLAKDFKQMAGLGINLIRYEQSKIYDYNVLKYSRENNLKVLYSFWIPETIDFANDKAQLADLKRRILKRIVELKHHKHIIGWNIGNDIWYAQTKRYDYTDLQKQQRAYFLWLFDLASEIKLKDSTRYLVKDISINHLATRQLENIRSLDIPFDAMGMVTEKEGFVNDFLQVCLDNKIPIIVNDIEVDTYIKSAGRFNDIPIILRNWENQRLSDKITFDGLLDFEGRKKTNFLKLENFWNEKKKLSSTTPEIRILKPSLPLLSGNPVTYTALYLKNGDWLSAETSDKYRFEWRLIKNDDFGNGLAMKNLGSSPVITLKVPVNYENYSLMLTVVAGDVSSSYKTTLNTPLFVIR